MVLAVSLAFVHSHTLLAIKSQSRQSPFSPLRCINALGCWKYTTFVIYLSLFPLFFRLRRIAPLISTIQHFITLLLASLGAS